MTAVAANYITTIVSTAEATTYNLGNVVIPADGLVAVIVSLVTSSRVAIASATLGGTAMTLVRLAPTGGFENIAMFQVAAVAGTYNLTVVMAGDIGATQANVTAHVWNIVGGASQVLSAVSTGATSLAMNTLANGAAIFGVQGSASPASFNHATTRYGPTFTGFIYNLAGDLVTTAETPHTETAGTSNFSMLGAAWEYGTTEFYGTPGTAANWNGDFVVVRPVTPSGNCVLQSISTSFSAVTGGGNIRAVIYSDASGAPGTLLAWSAEVAPVGSGVDQTLVMLTPPTLVSGTQYWIGFVHDTWSQNQPFTDSSVAASTMRYSTTITALASPTTSLTFGSPSTPSTSMMIWATVVPAAPSAGPRSAGNFMAFFS